MIGEKTMRDLKKRILAQVGDEAFIEIVEQDLDIFFDEVRKIKLKQGENK